jgi:hypothetical protein
MRNAERAKRAKRITESRAVRGGMDDRPIDGSSRSEQWPVAWCFRSCESDGQRASRQTLAADETQPCKTDAERAPAFRGGARVDRPHTFANF